MEWGSGIVGVVGVVEFEHVKEKPATANWTKCSNGSLQRVGVVSPFQSGKQLQQMSEQHLLEPPV